MRITLSSSFLWRPLHDYEVKPPNLPFYGGREQTTTKFPSSFWTWIKSLRIQPQEKSPAFDILSRSRYSRLSLKERKFFFLPMFSLLSSSSLLKVLNILNGEDYPHCCLFFSFSSTVKHLSWCMPLRVPSCFLHSLCSTHTCWWINCHLRSTSWLLSTFTST